MQSVSQEYLDAFRKPVKYDRITGNIKLVDGTVIPITDSSIVQGSLQTKQRVCGSKMDIGSCNIGEISIGLFDSEAYDHDFGGALIKLRYEICTDLENDTWQSCDLKPYFVDGQQVKRVRNKLTLKGYDSAQKFDKQIPEITSADLFSTLNYVANYCGVGVATTEDEFNAYPNANITADFSSPRIQTCQDCIMWIAQTVNCCAFINHQGLLVLKPYSFFSASTSALDRQVFATERTGIEYSDSRIYLAYLASYCGGKSKNYEKITQSTGTDAPHVKEGAISLPQNPIISNLTEDEQDAVNMAYLKNRQLPARYIKSKGFVDPAIEPLDVVGFLGGNIDVDKQIIGSVTEVVWKFRGEGTITCNTFDEATNEAGSDSAAALMTLSADDSSGTTTTTNRIAPRKTQLEKRVDALEERGGDTFNDAIIITQGDIPYILHSYSVVEYLRDWIIAAKGPDTQIIVNGYIVHDEYSLDLNTATIYSIVRFDAATTNTGALSSKVLKIAVSGGGRTSDGYSYINFLVLDENDSKIRGPFQSFGTFGLVLTFSYVYAPDELHPFGYAQIKAWTVYTDKNGALVRITNALTILFASFFSTDEYEAAIRLVKSPDVGNEVIESTVKDDGNSTLEKAMLYTDTVAKSLQDSFSNITEADREQIEQNASDIAAHNVRITAAEAEIDEINAPTTGILPQAKSYTDFVADELRGEFGTT